MSNYYSERLSADRLELCYRIAPPRVRQYLEAELEFVLGKLRWDDRVLELGCGYGRVLPSLAARARCVIGIDTSLSSLSYGRKSYGVTPECHLARMDAARPAFHDRTFDAVVCIQNGISAFHRDQRQLIREAVRITRHGGMVLFSSYSEKFWPYRLEWFRLQAGAGLVGELDEDRTSDGVIVCKDGFTASTVSRERFLELASGLPVRTEIVEVDQSSLFCVIMP